VRKLWQSRIREPLIGLLKQGIAPQRLALSVAIGIVVGNMPILGVSTVLCAAIAIGFRLNLPAIQIAQAAMAPVQIVLIIPFVRLGEWMLRAPPQPLTIKAGLALLGQGVGHAIIVLRDAILHAGFAWVVVAPAAIYALFRLLTPMFERAAEQLAARRGAAGALKVMP